MPVFRTWGKTIVVAGDKPGAAQVMKLTNNMLCAVAFVATSEAMTMSGKAGIPPEAMLQILNNGTGRNFATMQLFPQAVLPGTFNFGATIEILMKDVDLAIEQGEDLGVPMWVCQAARLVSEARRLSGPRATGSIAHRPDHRGRHAQGVNSAHAQRRSGSGATETCHADFLHGRIGLHWWIGRCCDGRGRPRAFQGWCARQMPPHL